MVLNITRKFQGAYGASMSRHYVATATSERVILRQRRPEKIIWRSPYQPGTYWVDIVPDESMLITHNSEGLFQFYSLPDCKLILRLEDLVTKHLQSIIMAIDPEGRYMIVPYTRREGDPVSILRFDLKTFEVRSLDELEARGWKTAQARMMPDGTVMVLGRTFDDRFERIRLVDGEKAEQVDGFDLHSFQPANAWLEDGRAWLIDENGRLTALDAEGRVTAQILLPPMKYVGWIQVIDGKLWVIGLLALMILNPDTLAFEYGEDLIGGVIRLEPWPSGRVLVVPSGGHSYLVRMAKSSGSNVYRRRRPQQFML